MNILSKLKYTTLYHGDCFKFKTLKPVAIDFGNLFTKPGWSVFFWKTKESAENWAVYKTLCSSMGGSLCRLNDSSGTHFLFWPKGNITVVSEEKYNEFCKIVEDIHSTAYVYRCEVPSSQVHMGNDSAHKEYTVRMEVSNFQLSEIYLNANTVKKYIKVLPKSTIESELRHSSNVRGLLPSMLLVNDFRYQISQNCDMVNSIYFQNPPEPGDDIEKWLKDNNYKIRKVSPIERTRDYIKDKIETSRNRNNLNEACKNIMKESFDYQTNSDDCEKIIKSLNKKENDYVGGGYWIRSDHVYYRKIEYINNEPAGFIDVYTLPKFKNAGLVVLAVDDKYRGRGVAKRLVNNAMSFCKSQHDLHYLRWLADKDNAASINLAKSCGFQERDRTKNELIFEYPIKCYSSDLKGIVNKTR